MNDIQRENMSLASQSIIPIHKNNNATICKISMWYLPIFYFSMKVYCDPALLWQNLILILIYWYNFQTTTLLQYHKCMVIYLLGVWYQVDKQTVLSCIFSSDVCVYHSLIIHMPFHSENKSFENDKHHCNCLRIISDISILQWQLYGYQACRFEPYNDNKIISRDTCTACAYYRSKIPWLPLKEIMVILECIMLFMHTRKKIDFINFFLQPWCI